MSVGVQRLRDDPDRLRRGALDKGEDPSIVDHAVEMDDRRRALLADSDALKAERNAASKRIGEAVRGGADPNGPEVGELKAASTAAGERIDAMDAELATVEAELEDAHASHPEPRGSRRAGRRRGGERHGPHLGRPTARRRSAAALGARREARPHRPGARREGRRLGLPGVRRCRIGAAAGAHQLVPRHAHQRERHDRGLAARRRQRRQRARHGADPGQGGPDVRRHPRRPLPGPDCRGPGHEPPPRRDHRGR